MPVEVDIFSRKRYNQFINGINFDQDLTNFTNNLIGNVIERVKLVTEVGFQWYANTVPSNTWDVLTDLLTRQSGSWRNDGFAVNDDFVYLTAFGEGGEAFQFAGTVDSISGDGLRLFFTVTGGAVVPGFGFDTVGIRGISTPDNIIYKFGLTENSESGFSNVSKVSGNNQSFYGTGIATGAVLLEPKGIERDWLTGAATCEYVYDSGNSRVYEITHTFRLGAYFLEGELNNITNSIPPEILKGDNSLKYVFQADFRNALSNPNQVKVVQDINNLGSTGYDGENNNGFTNDYTVDSIAYEETIGGATLNGLKLCDQTTVTIIASRISTPFVGGERVGAFVHYLPPQGDYTDKTTDQDFNFIIDQVYTNEGDAITDSDFITDFLVVESGGILTISFKVLYSAAQQLRVASDGKYAIKVHLGDQALAASLSDASIVLADVNDYIHCDDIEGLIAITKWDQYDHSMQVGIDPAYTSLVLCNNDGVTHDIGFDLDLNKSSLLNTLSFEIVAYNTVTDETFTLDTYSLPLPTIISGGVQQLNIATDRGYIFYSLEQFNDVLMIVGANVGGIQSYNLQIGQKINWKTWQENLTADTIFYDLLEPNDNLNYKTSNYSDLNNYEIRFALRSNCDGVDTLGEAGNTDNLFLSPNSITYDYDLDGEITPVWSTTIETFNNDTASNIGGAILSGTDTLVKMTCVNSIAPVTNIVPMWGEIFIQDFQSLGNDIPLASTLYDIGSGSPFKPLSGDTVATMSIEAGDVVVRVLVDGSQVLETDQYTLFGRIHDGIPANSKLTSPDSTPKETSGGANDIKVTSP